MKLLWSQFQGKSYGELGGALQDAAKSVRQVTIEDLVATSPEQSTGLYFFFKGETLMYVGKAGSRAFIERVPSHFDSRPGSWFGTLLKKLAERASGCTPAECIEDALGMRLALLVADAKAMAEDDLKDLLESTESNLRAALHPQLNTPKHPKDIDPDTPLVPLN